MNSVITFDVTNNQEFLIREQMRASGYFISWVSGEGADKKTINLPHNVVWKPNTESSQALIDLKDAIDLINQNRGANNKIELLRCIILNSTPWRAIYGAPI